MNEDFKAAIIMLMQHPIMRQPISELSDNQCMDAYELIKTLIEHSVDEHYTLYDYIQMARLHYCLGELALQLDDDPIRVIEHYRVTPRLLEKGGFDLSLKKWLELVTVRTPE